MFRAALAWARRVEARVDAVVARAGGWLLDHRPRTRRHWLWTGLCALLVAVLTLNFLTMPPPMPDYASVRAAWQPSEAWLYDRNGVLTDSSRVDFARRRLGWTPSTRSPRRSPRRWSRPRTIASMHMAGSTGWRR
ncbi:hypothetical protein [Sphingomonas panacisoli]|uniref:hypothetical protein n=1 Tax=Sphingomonas panacisoli TaxID=1813879 RepID=UPI003B8452E1